jgi:His/Glu/Gln/Arg/opine family amino acid ABC transporter permease subunit
MTTDLWLGYQLNWSVVVSNLPTMLRALVYSLEIALGTLGCAFALGLVIAVCRMSAFPPLSLAAYAYIQIFRALSLYVYILWVYFGLGVAFGINLTPLQAAIVSLTFLYSAYTAEIFRASLGAVDAGQREAASALGLGAINTFVLIALPQALRIAIPALVNSLVDIVKDSAIVAIIGAGDLMYATIQLSNYYVRSFEFYTSAAVMYLVVIILLTRIAGAVERIMPVRTA